MLQVKYGRNMDFGLIVMGIFDVYSCPNKECSHTETLKKGTKCPLCGADAKVLDGLELSLLRQIKNPELFAKNGGVAYCSNFDCINIEELKTDDKCPTCGARVILFGFLEGAQLIREKNKKFASRGDGEGFLDLLVTEQMSEKEIRNLINTDMRNLAKHEAGTAWMRVGTLLSFNSTDQMLGAGFKAIIDQNKILIRQNELILRKLQNNIVAKQG